MKLAQETAGSAPEGAVSAQSAFDAAAAAKAAKKNHMTRREAAWLAFKRDKGAIISRQELMMELWQSDAFIDDNTLTVNVNRLRKSLASIGVPDGFLATRRGQGYLV